METFKSRFGVIAVLLGMAVGTGNIWRFPRVLAQNGGGAFLIPWFLFLFLWSIPLLMIEFSLGKTLRRGVIGAFGHLTRGRLTWLGGFIVCCTLGIMFYYSVVTGWCLYYSAQALSGSLFNADPRAFWETFTGSGVWPLVFHAASLVLAAAVIQRGAQKGVETLNRLLIPTLFVLLAVLAAYACTLPGRAGGLSFIFNTDFSKLADARVWLEALTQSAWSTGAGWGLALSYACYARSEDDPFLTPASTGFGNNSIELLAAMAVIPPLFTYYALPDIQAIMAEGNTGLTFISLPALFARFPFGRAVSCVFFVALFFAAFTSLVAMYELGTRFLQDFGIGRPKAIAAVGGVAFLLGGFSARNMNLLDNQDWVWGVGLLVSGFLFTRLVAAIGPDRYTREFLGLGPGFVSVSFKAAVRWLLPAQFFILLGWWFYQSFSWDPEGWLHPFRTFSVGTCLFQWGLLFLCLRLLNARLSRRLLRESSGGN